MYVQFSVAPLTRHGMSSILGGESLILASSGINTKSQVRYASTHHDMEVMKNHK